MRITLLFILILILFTMAKEYSAEDIKGIVTYFKELGLKPDLQSSAEFQDSLVKYVTDLQKVKTDPDTEAGDVDASAEQGATGTDKKKIPSYFPKISTFSGEGKQDAAFEVWKYEVQCLVNDGFNDATISLAIRRSLRGEASACAMRLGAGAKVADIIKALNDVFGSLERGESIMEQFYSAHQKKDEDSMKWGCRIEEIMRKAVEKGLVPKADHRTKLRERYWSGLCQWLKDITGHKFDSIQDFEQLRREVRLIEKDHEKKSTPHMVMASSSDESLPNSDMAELKGIINQLATKVDGIQQQQEQLVSKYQRPRGNGQPNYHGRGQGQRNQYPSFQRQGQGQGYNQQFQSRQQFGQTPQQLVQPTQGHAAYPQQTGYYGNTTPYEEPTCFRCGQKGHLQRGCRVLLDHSKRGRQLNYNSPGSRGRR